MPLMPPDWYAYLAYYLRQYLLFFSRYLGIFFLITFTAFTLVYTQTDWRRAASVMPFQIDEDIRSGLTSARDPLTEKIDQEIRRFFVPPEYTPQAILKAYGDWCFAPWNWFYGWTGFGTGQGSAGDRIGSNQPAWDLSVSYVLETFIWACTALILSLFISLTIGLWRATQPGYQMTSIRLSLLSCVPVYIGVYLLYGLKGQIIGDMASGTTPFLIIAITAIAFLDGILLDNVTVFHNAWSHTAQRKFVDTSRVKFSEMTVIPPAEPLQKGDIISRLLQSLQLLYTALMPANLWLMTKGLKDRIADLAATVNYHILKNVLIAIIPTWSTRLSIFVSAAVVIEIPVGALVEPGLGRAFLTGYQQGEWPLVLNAIWLTAALLISFSMAVDLMYQQLNRDKKGSEGIIPSSIDSIQSELVSPVYRYVMIGLIGVCITLGLIDFIISDTSAGQAVFNTLVATLLGTLTAGTLGITVGIASLWRPSLSLFMLQTVELFPRVVLVSLLYFPVVGGTDSRFIELFVLGILSGFVSFPDISRIIRARIQSYKTTDFIDAAKAVGLSHWSIFRDHIWPDSKAVFGAVIAQAWVTVIFVESAVSFYTAVGLGESVSLSAKTLGGRLADLRGFQHLSYDLISWLFTISLIILTILIAKTFEKRMLRLLHERKPMALEH